MYSVIRSGELQPTPGGTVKFKGEPYGSGVSFYLVNNQPGMGPGLHKHPYSETWIIRNGKGLFTADGQEFEAGPGDILVVGPETLTNSRTSVATGWRSFASMPRPR